jgi:hypothetical protein
MVRSRRIIVTLLLRVQLAKSPGSHNAQNSAGWQHYRRWPTTHNCYKLHEQWCYINICIRVRIRVDSALVLPSSTAEEDWEATFVRFIVTVPLCNRRYFVGERKKRTLLLKYIIFYYSERYSRDTLNVMKTTGKKITNNNAVEANALSFRISNPSHHSSRWRRDDNEGNNFMQSNIYLTQQLSTRRIIVFFIFFLYHFNPLNKHS